MKTSHTPLPWIMHAHEIWKNCSDLAIYISEDDYDGEVICTIEKIDTKEVNIANAAFIVKAVNFHYKLLSILERIEKNEEAGIYDQNILSKDDWRVIDEAKEQQP